MKTLVSQRHAWNLLACPCQPLLLLLAKVRWDWISLHCKTMLGILSASRMPCSRTLPHRSCRFTRAKYSATCTEAVEFTLFDKTICGLLNIENSLSFEEIGEILGFNVTDNPSQKKCLLGEAALRRAGPQQTRRPPDRQVGGGWGKRKAIHQQASSTF